jgi:hypothetical protein
MFYKIAEDTGTNLVWVNANTDKELYDISINKIKSFEFTSGFIYGLFERKI